MRRHSKLRPVICSLALVAVSLATATPSASAEVTSEVRAVRSGIAHDMLFDLAFEGARGLTVGTFGNVLVSEDGGVEWRPADVPRSDLALLGSAISAGHCLAVGQGGVILVADDCRRWQVSTSGSAERLMAVSLNRRGLAYAVGAFGTVLRSPDGGHSWSPIELDWSEMSPTGAEPHLYDVNVTEDGMVTVVGEFGLVLHGRDGLPLKLTHSGEQSLFGLHVGGGEAFAVGQGGAVLVSNDSGASWRAQATGSSAILTSVWSDGHGRVVASGLNTVLQSTDGGRNWRRVDAGPYAQSTHTAVAASQPDGGKPRVMVVGAAATVLKLAR
jgi:photosystem II stability/assembly factor-like uncharacterized protein